MTFRLVLLVCSMLNGEPECRHEEQPQIYSSFKECAEAGQRSTVPGAQMWKCRLRPGEESA